MATLSLTTIQSAAFLIAVVFLAANAGAETLDAEAASKPTVLETKERGPWQLRVGFGVNPVIDLFDSGSSQPHTGFGASLSGFYEVLPQLGVGAGWDWDRYTYDARVQYASDVGPSSSEGEILTQSRLLALVQWVVLPSRNVTPFVVLGGGYGWQNASLISPQCSQDLASGFVWGGGGGVDILASKHASVGVEYRINTLPGGARTCTLASAPGEPAGPPQDFLSQRAAFTLSLNY